MKTCFIVNPNSGGGRGLKLWNKARAYMDKHGLEYEIVYTALPGDAESNARRLSTESGDELTIFVIGSDITFSGVVNGIRHPERVRLGYIPVCTRYGCARSLRLSDNPKTVIRNFNSAAGSRVEAIDYGVMTGTDGETVRRFMNSAGIGFDAAVFRRMERFRREKMDPLGTADRFSLYREIIKELIFGKPVRGYIELDGTKRIEFNNLTFVSVHIHPFECAFRLGSYADPKDGMLEVCAVSCRSRLKLFMAIMKSRFGILRASGKVRLLQCSEAHIHFDKESAVHADGDVVDNCTDIDLRCVRQQLHIIR